MRNRFPSQTDTLAWVRMLAAARGADTITDDGAQALEADPRTKMRLYTLLPVARALYDEFARQTANEESQLIEKILAHCYEVIRAKSSGNLSMEYRPSPAEPWDAKQCDSEAQKLLFPYRLQSLRLTPPDVIGLQLIPLSSAWRLLRNEINRRIPKTGRHVRQIYCVRFHANICKGTGKLEKMQPLRNKTFVDAVLWRAPPLVRVLPPRWTAADTSDKLHEALVGIFGRRQTPGLDRLVSGLTKSEFNRLVNRLSTAEFAGLIEEHSCLWQVVNTGDWAPICADGRNRGDYVAFAHILTRQKGFVGVRWPGLFRLRKEVQSHRQAAAYLNPSGNYWSLAGMSPDSSEPAMRALESASGVSAKRRRLDRVPSVGPVAFERVASASSLQSADNRDCEPALGEPIGRLSLPDQTDPASGDPAELVFAFSQLPEEPENHIGLVCGLPAERPASRAGGSLALIDGAKVVSGVAAGPMTVTGSVAAFGLLLFVAALILRHRSRFAVGQSRAHAVQL